MKRSLFCKPLKHALLAVPACALMLGAAQAGTTVGLNFQAWYYDSNTTPQTIGYGNGYQTTGFPVTGRAFGVDAANWANADPMPCQSAINGYATFNTTNTIFAGSLTAFVTAPNAWQSGIGALVDGWHPENVAPGNNEVTWGYLDDGNTTGNHSTVKVAGLASLFAHGYVIQTIAANGGTKTFDNVDITDGTTTNVLAYTTYPMVDTVDPEYDGTVGVSASSGTFTDGTIQIIPEPKTSGNRSVLAGFIITDQPVVSSDPTDTTVNQGATLTLTATVIGVGPLAYQWQHAGTNFPGATNLPFATTATVAAGGSWVLVATNLYGTATSEAATVTVNQVPSITTDLATATNLVYAGTPVALTVVAGGANPLSYQWYQNGAAISGATNATLIASNLTAGLFGYHVAVSNLYSPPVALSSTNYLNVVAAPDAYTAAVAADSPNSYWPFAETTGTVAYDYSGSGHNAAISNGVTLGAAGPRPSTFPGFSSSTKAYQFDGSSGFVGAGTAASLGGSTDFTVEAWINTSSATTQVIAQQRDSAGYLGEYQFTVNASGNLNFYIYNSAYQADVTTATSVADGAWHQVAAVRSGTYLYIYVDGALAASGSGTVVALGPTLQTFIGSDQRDGVSYFNGSLAAVAIYSHALSSGRIVQHYVVGTGTALTVSLQAGGMIQDSKPAGTLHPGQAHNIGWTNSVTDAAGTPVTRTGVAVFSESSSSQITTPDNADFDTTNGTVCFWLTAEAPLPGAGSEGAMLVDRRTTNGAVIVLHDDGSIFWQGQSGSANGFSGGYIPDGNWHHVAVTYGLTTNDTLSIYVDGQLAASTGVTNGWTWPTNQEIEIGVSHDSYWQKFDGQMDDFRIYKRILTATEVAQVYASDALVDTNSLAVRYNFDSATYGRSVAWPYGVLQTSPTLGPSAVWTTVTNAVSPYGYLPTSSALFFRAYSSP
jgi:hypothetical protein